jgi:hypothetical protein
MGMLVDLRRGRVKPLIMQQLILLTTPCLSSRCSSLLTAAQVTKIGAVPNTTVT